MVFGARNGGCSHSKWHTCKYLIQWYIECIIYNPLAVVTLLGDGGYPPGHVTNSIPGNPCIQAKYGKQWAISSCPPFSCKCITPPAPSPSLNISPTLPSCDSLPYNEYNIHLPWTNSANSANSKATAISQQLVVWTGSESGGPLFLDGIWWQPSVLGSHCLTSHHSHIILMVGFFICLDFVCFRP
jgi:hypothetical protein